MYKRQSGNWERSLAFRRAGKQPARDWRLRSHTVFFIVLRTLDRDKIVTYCRVDNDLSQWIEETTTLMGSKNDYLS